jgi:hypothetical protein
VLAELGLRRDAPEAKPKPTSKIGALFGRLFGRK